ncbi:MAG: DUF4252 domain-containing protein [Terriglobales bacterium]
MRVLRIILPLSMAISAAHLAGAQQQSSGQTYSGQLSRQTPAPSQREILPRGLESLRQDASSKTEFTLDHSMLVLASKLDPNNEDLRRVIAGVSGISVHDFRYAGSWSYEPESLDSIREEYRAAGWMRMANKHDKNGEGRVTDVWIRMRNNAISNVAILAARPREVDFVVVSGSISPVDIAHLGGHFGIPNIEGGIEVPNTRR